MSDPGPTKLVQALREGVTTHATELVLRLSNLLRTSGIHGLNNEAWAIHLNALHQAVSQLMRAESTAELEVLHGQVLVNGFPLKPGFGDVNVFRYLADELEKRRI